MLHLKITIVSSEHSWLNSYIKDFIDSLTGCTISWLHNIKEIKNGDIAFFLSFEEIVQENILKKHKNNLVVHGSALPQGKGMSPITWQILEGKNEIPITLFEMVKNLDSGKIYLQDMMGFNDTELVDEIREKQAKYTFKLCHKFLNSYPNILKQGKKQLGKETFYRRRIPKDGELDIDKTIAEQFNLLRIADNRLYPAFFTINKNKYQLNITRIK